MKFKEYFKKMTDALISVDEGALDKAVDMLRQVASSKGKIILVGNGASAAIASHVAVDLTKASGIRAVNFNEADLITCFANDYGYEHWVEKALDFYADSKDLLILISSSGMSSNIINAALKAREMGLSLITLSGFDKDNILKKSGDINFWVDSCEYNIVETVHQAWLLAMVDKIQDLRIKGEKF